VSSRKLWGRDVVFAGSGWCAGIGLGWGLWAEGEGGGEEEEEEEEEEEDGGGGKRQAGACIRLHLPFLHNRSFSASCSAIFFGFFKSGCICVMRPCKKMDPLILSFRNETKCLVYLNAELKG